MKKLLVMFVLMLLALPININASEKVNVYAFVGNGCPHCAELEEYLDDVKDKFNINVIYYEVWYNKINAEVLDVVQKHYKVAESVPFMIIGEENFQGYAPYMNESIENAIANYEQDDAELLEFVKDAVPGLPKTSPNYIILVVVSILIVGLYFFIKPKKKVA